MRSDTVAGLAVRRTLLATALLLGACSGGSGDDPVSLTTTTAAPTTTTTWSGPRMHLFPSTTAPLPRPGEPLADGVHAVHVVGVEGDRVTVDVVQFLTGEAARAEYEAESGDPTGPADDYLVRNASHELRTLRAAPAIAVTFANEGGPGEFPASLDDLSRDVAARLDVTYWLTVEGGLVIRLDEQWVP